MKGLVLLVAMLGPWTALADSIFQPMPGDPHETEVIYLAMPDRFARTEPFPKPEDSAVKEGFDPENAYFFHGGSLTGLERHLDYLQHLTCRSSSMQWSTTLRM